jgi:hypothetical protein
LNLIFIFFFLKVPNGNVIYKRHIYNENGLELLQNSIKHIKKPLILNDGNIEDCAETVHVKLLFYYKINIIIVKYFIKG